MSLGKSEKELALLYDLYVAPDWSERFAGLFDEHVKPPAAGRILYLGAATGEHALDLLKRASKDVTLVGTDEQEARVEIAQGKALALKLNDRAEFRRMLGEELDFDDEEFDLVCANASLVQPERLPELVAEIARVARPGAHVALLLPTASSFGEFFSIYWEALLNAGAGENGTVENLIAELPVVSDIEARFKNADLREIITHTNKEEFEFATASDFLDAPLIQDFLLQSWTESLTAEDRATVLTDLQRIIDEEREDAPFVLSIKATLVIGRKQ